MSQDCTLSPPIFDLRGSPKPCTCGRNARNSCNGGSTPCVITMPLSSWTIRDDKGIVITQGVEPPLQEFLAFRPHVQGLGDPRKSNIGGDNVQSCDMGLSDQTTQRQDRKS